MAAVSKRKLSGSTDGKAIKLAATSTPGTTLHTAVSGTTPGLFDELWIWLVNSDTLARKVTLEFGGTTSPDNLIETTVPAEDGGYLAVPGFILQNGAIVRGFCATANVVMAYGFVNAMTP